LQGLRSGLDRNDAAGLTLDGRLTYRQNQGGPNFQATSFSSMIVNNGHATIRGQGSTGGVAVSFTVNVDDAAPGHDDTFAIDLSNGYHAEGNLRSGRIDVGC
jgi:hypothetical protein